MLGPLPVPPLPYRKGSGVSVSPRRTHRQSSCRLNGRRDPDPFRNPAGTEGPCRVQQQIRHRTPRRGRCRHFTSTRDPLRTTAPTDPSRERLIRRGTRVAHGRERFGDSATSNPQIGTAPSSARYSFPKIDAEYRPRAWTAALDARENKIRVAARSRTGDVVK